ncbi:MAG TPA: ABC transporter permease [Thermomicrobiales bacterium]|nr:ABC transporter permease [Thermomicrobiales bacterium]
MAKAAAPGRRGRQRVAARRGAPGGTLAGEQPRRTDSVVRRFARNRVVVGWGVVLGALILMAVFAPLLAPSDPLRQSAELLVPPSWPHPFGTDELGRDILSRIIYGGRISLTVGLVAVGIAAGCGTLVGLASGFTGGALDSVIMRIIDMLMAFPGIILAILIMSTLGPSLINVMVAVGISAIPWYARTVRGATLAVKESEFIFAARAVGAGPGRIMYRHILPNVVGPVIVLGTIGIAGAILAISGLSFLGLGAQPPSPEWGSMLSQARVYLRRAWWITTFPGLAIMLSVLAINIIGDALRDALDPRLRGAIKD